MTISCQRRNKAFEETAPDAPGLWMPRAMTGERFAAFVEARVDSTDTGRRAR